MKTLRHESTSAEQAAWEVLRDRRVDGLKFRRQQILCGFIVDFFCASEGLVVEIDGDIHGEQDQIARDQRRDQALSDAGYRTIRVRNDDVATTLVERIRQRCGRCAQRTPEGFAPSPFREKGLGDEAVQRRRRSNEDARRRDRQREGAVRAAHARGLRPFSLQGRASREIGFAISLEASGLPSKRGWGMRQDSDDVEATRMLVDETVKAKGRC
ncbi:MAG TPA: endonuclease domain-containing protein, partial [Myxococcota bacterium]